MEFIKKVLVLKQIEKDYSTGKKAISGIARVEIENSVAELFLSIINLSPPTNGCYYAFIVDKNRKVLCEKAFSSSMHKTFNFVPDLSSLSVGIIHVVDYIPITVAFSSTENSDNALRDFKKSVAEYFSTLRLKEKKTEQPPVQEKQIASEVLSKPQPDYNDEVVATENYFEFDKLEDKLELFKEIDDETISPKNELPSCGCQEKAQEIDKNDNCAKDEESSSFGEKYDDKRPYYLSVRRELDEIFLKFESEQNLEKMFFKSRWSKVFYSESKYYVVGLVFEENKEKYICYGVPGEYSSEPPKELKGYCSFIPLSIFSLHGDGYWMMFQDAVTGECKKPLL